MVVKNLPKLRKISFKNKKHKYKINQSDKKRRFAINEGILKEKYKTKKNIKDAAQAKKARFNILRIYRRYKNPKECKILTKDMKYIDKKYGLGETKNICGKSKKKNKQKKQSGGKKTQTKKAVAILVPEKKIPNNKVNGIIRFTQKNGKVNINYDIKNLPKGYHGFHIHKFGDLTNGCKSAGPHFNTYKKNIHGGPNSKVKHNGDLGNIFNKKNNVKGTKKISSKVLSIEPCAKNSIIGRSIIVHKDKDDLGKGNNLESLITGNAGARLACGVIGLA
tara:strand:+ start:2995 stop:3825 length:831 start_codon:yes stop_codon:yes gene_type:complete